MRARHPLEGRSLEPIGWMRRRGALELILVLPDGSRALVPVSWTDFERTAGQPGAGTLASLADLLEIRRVLDGVLRRCVLAGGMIGARKPTRRPILQLRLDLGESPAPATALWGLLPEPSREAAAALVARLIARTVAPSGGDGDE